MASAFGVDLERVHILGYPRNDRLKDKSQGWMFIENWSEGENLHTIR